jgi:hypothetical protein
MAHLAGVVGLRTVVGAKHRLPKASGGIFAPGIRLISIHSYAIVMMFYYINSVSLCLISSLIDLYRRLISRSTLPEVRRDPVRRGPRPPAPDPCKANYGAPHASEAYPFLVPPIFFGRRGCLIRLDAPCRLRCWCSSDSNIHRCPRQYSPVAPTGSHGFGLAPI